MILNEYLSPVGNEIADLRESLPPRALIHFAQIHHRTLDDPEGADLAVIGIPEGRTGGQFIGTDGAPARIREQFYRLMKPKSEVKIADLGDIKPGDTIRDTLFALEKCVYYLLERRIVPVILGGPQDLAYGQYAAYQGRKHNLNLAAVDSKLDLKQPESEHDHASALYRIIAHQPNYLFNVVHLASQNYFIEQESLDAFEKMNFDLVRLGYVRGKVQEMEPLLRNADLLLMSMNSIRASDAPASVEANPNGLFAEEACQLMRYAGMASDLSSVGIYDLNAATDIDDRSAKLAAQMLWYFMDGFYNRRNDYPVPDSKDYMIYRTTFKSSSHEIVFYKHLHSERWWMEVPFPNEKSRKNGMFLVPCNYSDYQAALNDEIPDRWMKAYTKLL